MDFSIRLECPHCRGVVKNQLKSIVPGKTRKCPNCLKHIAFTRDDVGRAVYYVESTLKKHPAPAEFKTPAGLSC